MRRFINIYIPVTTCNLKCNYCYITQSGLWKSKIPEFKYSAKEVRNALSVKRLGGVCHINICGGGETLLPSYIVEIVKQLLEEGHYIMIVTNGTLEKRFDEFMALDDCLKMRLGFKFSLHYMQLKENKRNMNLFLSNVKKVQESVCSYSVEMTPSDDLIPYIYEIKDFCISNFGALCHITVARNTIDSSIPILTKLTRDDYRKTWSVFDSPMFDFKLSTFNEKRSEYCYAGDWSLWLNLGTGIATQCYSSYYRQNIIDNPDKPILFCPIGCKCNVPHCHNSHALLTLGVIPDLPHIKYSEVRDRVTKDGKHWLNDEMRVFLEGELKDSNCLYSTKEKKKKKRLLNYLHMKHVCKQVKSRFLNM